MIKRRYKVVLLGIEEEPHAKPKRKRPKLRQKWESWSWQLQTAAMCYALGLLILVARYIA